MTVPPTTTTVSVVVPTLDEASSIDACLARITEQVLPPDVVVVEVLVVDGGSTDDTIALAARVPGVRVLRNPDRIQAAALNVALDEAVGDVLVRVDGHSLIAPDYVASCVEALERTGAAMVGGAQRPVGGGLVQRGMAAAMRSRLGVGAAAFYRDDRSGWVDTVWMGAFHTGTARDIGGYDATLPINEDAEFAARIAAHGGVWLDPGIVAHYEPRGRLRDVVRQWSRYGLWRGRNVRRTPALLRPRQLAVPLLLLGLLSPARRWVLPVYLAALGAGSVAAVRRDRVGAAMFWVVVPVTHLCWGAGFFAGLATGRRR
jgi:glycosyltransferase involved in cell wall biosynthesis